MVMANADALLEQRAHTQPTAAAGRVVPSWLSAIVLLGVYMCAALLLDPGGYMGSDTGGKAATVAVMSHNQDWSPDIGYWAESWDPEGDLHPYFGTTRRGDSWIQVTSLPMIIAARPLWDLGGEKAVLILPMLGSVLAALAAGRLSVQMGAADSWPAVWVVGLSTPVAIYALDFWEHSLGLAAMGWSFVLVLKVLSAQVQTGRAELASAFGSGIGFGFAANMRQEALIYGFIAGVVLFATLRKRDRSLVSWLGPCVAMAVGTLLMLGANVALEKAVLDETARTSRSVGTLSGTADSGISLRLSEALITFASPVDHVHWSALLLAAMVAVGLVWATVSHVRSTELTRPVALLGVASLALLLRLIAFGPGFVSGMLAAAPLAGAGLALLWLNNERLIAVLALAPLPLVWSFQYTRAAAPQWGGRYILPTGLLLVAYAMSQRSILGPKLHRWVKSLVVAGAAMTLIGVTFLHQRTHGFAEASQALANRPESALIFDDPFLAREAGPVGVSENWLAAEGVEQRAKALAIIELAEFDSFAYIGNVFDGPIEFEGFAARTSEELVFFEHTRVVLVTSYERVR